LVFQQLAIVGDYTRADLSAVGVLAHKFQVAPGGAAASAAPARRCWIGYGNAKAYISMPCDNKLLI
jgi:hypothetical protein